MPERSKISLGILAGGLGSRLGFADKAVLEFHGRTLLDRTIQAAGAGFGQQLLSYNGSDPRNERLGMAWVADRRAGNRGPLAGIEALLFAATTDWLLTLPVDIREPDPSVIDRLCENPGIPKVVRDADGLQPLIALWKVSEARPAISAALDAGHGAVHAMILELRMAELDISPLRLGNLNHPADFD